MGPIDGLVYGFALALTPTNRLTCFTGVAVGTVMGIGPVGAMALRLPSTLALHPARAYQLRISGVKS